MPLLSAASYIEIFGSISCWLCSGGIYSIHVLGDLICQSWDYYLNLASLSWDIYQLFQKLILWYSWFQVDFSLKFVKIWSIAMMTMEIFKLNRPECRDLFLLLVSTTLGWAILYSPTSFSRRNDIWDGINVKHRRNKNHRSKKQDHMKAYL